jgi:hypothetical protein
MSYWSEIYGLKQQTNFKMFVWRNSIWAKYLISLYIENINLESTITRDKSKSETQIHLRDKSTVTMFDYLTLGASLVHQHQHQQQQQQQQCN